ncbi:MULTISPECIES: ROK family protein [unclassified Arcicella]|uniref:ROK family protein n=1 Tax=unclassified Arcicella TaxID=2644986 RepID=UPI00285CE94E|nr:MULTISPECIES: ROK family protein [unclassified Arcicella]MDR6562121.1 glucokinase [Arcicella sp. BE51]MDR6812184.1 glucokinase [Arcicella sp. BE140]MDR6823496.1 glucokinase [Arcicella sp. BE139]
MNKLAIGIDIGGTRTKIGLVDLALGQVIETTIFPTETKDATRFEQMLAEGIDRFKSRASEINVQLLGIGIGVSSFVFDDGTVDSTYGFIDFMEDYPLVKIIEENHLLPCRIDNDARLVALGEAVFGKGKGFERVLVLTLGTGLGLGFTVNGKLDGKLPYAHMGGHISIIQNDIPCYCGKIGCLESLVSATGIMETAKRLNWHQKYPNEDFTVESIFKASRADNIEAKLIVDNFLCYLKTGLSNYINLYAPDTIILGGGVAKGLKPYLTFLQNEILLGPYKKYKASIEISELEEHSGILGSAALFY